jgi:hypothetical protein
VSWTDKDDINDNTNDFNFDPGYSFQLMIAAGVLAIPAFFISCYVLFVFRKVQTTDPSNLSSSLVIGVPVRDSSFSVNKL